jgi:hypothetical protein
VKRFVSTFLISIGLALFVLALVISPQGVLESVWTGIATGLFTTGLVDLILSAIKKRERAEEVARRAGLIKPLDYYDPVANDDPLVDVVLSNDSDEVAIHVVVATHFPEGVGLIHTSAINRAIEWAPLTFDQSINIRNDSRLMSELPWQSGRVPIQFEHIPPKSDPRVFLRPVQSGGPERHAVRLEVPVRVAWSVPGDALRYWLDFEFIIEPEGAAHG